MVLRSDGSEKTAKHHLATEEGVKMKLSTLLFITSTALLISGYMTLFAFRAWGSIFFFVLSIAFLAGYEVSRRKEKRKMMIQRIKQEATTR